MNRCPNCAAQNRDGAKFCTSCGFRLPVDAEPAITADRSPFATTSSVPPYSQQAPPPASDAEPDDESGFATWGGDAPVELTPGLSWDTSPPPNTSVPVSDDMIAALVGDSDAEVADTPGIGNGYASAQSPNAAAVADDAVWDAAPRPTPRTGEIPPTIDHLLKLARELEYGLIELADAPTVSVVDDVDDVDSRLLANVLAELQDEDEMTPLRNAVASAQERPRDVDVMMDLVLRADAISALLTERDQLKNAIEIVLKDSTGSSNSSIADDDEMSNSDQTDEELEAAADDQVVPDPDPDDRRESN